VSKKKVGLISTTDMESCWF